MTKPAPKCPTCQKSVTEAHYKPFCSRRCADVDLGRWVTGNYTIATDETPEPDEYLEALSNALGDKKSDWQH